MLITMGPFLYRISEVTLLVAHKLKSILSMYTLYIIKYYDQGIDERADFSDLRRWILSLYCFKMKIKERITPQPANPIPM